MSQNTARTSLPSSRAWQKVLYNSTSRLKDGYPAVNPDWKERYIYAHVYGLIFHYFTNRTVMIQAQAPSSNPPESHYVIHVKLKTYIGARTLFNAVALEHHGNRIRYHPCIHKCPNKTVT